MGDVGAIHTETLQGADGGVAEGICRHLGEEGRVVPELSERGGNIGLCTAVANLEVIGLQESLVARRRQTQHDLTECYCFCHE